MSQPEPDRPFIHSTLNAMHYCPDVHTDKTDILLMKIATQWASRLGCQNTAKTNKEGGVCFRINVLFN